MILARLVCSADFERVLRTRTRASSTHFAVHHLSERPSSPRRPSAEPPQRQLSTGEMQSVTVPVDDYPFSTPPEVLWLGAVVPKRHARRSVTRSLLKRQIRGVVTRHAASMASGIWVVRLRAPFDRGRYASAASDELKRAARAELDLLLLRIAQVGVAE